MVLLFTNRILPLNHANRLGLPRAMDRVLRNRTGSRHPGGEEPLRYSLVTIDLEEKLRVTNYLASNKEIPLDYDYSIPLVA